MFSQMRNTLIACIILIASGGVFQTAAADTETNKAVVERWLELWNTQDLTIADEVFATDYVPHMPHYPDIVDVESYKAEIATIPTNIPDFHATLEDIIAEGDRVVARFTAAGTASGAFMGITVDGVPYTNTWIIMFRFAGGKIVEEWLQYDLLGVLEQWGAMPPSRPTPESYTWGPPSEVIGDPGDPAENKLLAMRIVTQFYNGKDIAGFEETHSPDVITHNPVIPGSPLDVEGYKQAALMHLAAIPDWHVDVHALIAEADKVAVYGTITGAHQGDLMGIPPSGKEVELTCMTIHRFADGKVVETWWAYDALGMMQQITSPPEYSPVGTWVVTVPTPLGDITMIHTVSPPAATGSPFPGVLEQVNKNPTHFGMFPEADALTDWVTQTVWTGRNTVKSTNLAYSTKQG
jgi:predicted ester cyclase